MKLRYFTGLLKTYDLRFVSAEKVSGDYVLVKLQAPSPMNWEAGQHGIFTLPGKKVKGKFFRVFTLASASTENTILIGTRTGAVPSPFKQALLDMKEGEIVKLRGPGGWFVVRDATSPIIMLATGIGVTPMRSMLYALKDDTARPIHLIHSSSDYYLFIDEFKELQKENDQIKLTYVAHREEFKEAIKAVAVQYGQSAYYYMAGSPAAVSATKALLNAQGIKRNRRIHESFQGYKQ